MSRRFRVFLLLGSVALAAHDDGRAATSLGGDWATRATWQFGAGPPVAPQGADIIGHTTLSQFSANVSAVSIDQDAILSVSKGGVLIARDVYLGIRGTSGSLEIGKEAVVLAEQLQLGSALREPDGRPAAIGYLSIQDGSMNISAGSGSGVISVFEGYDITLDKLGQFRASNYEMGLGGTLNVLNGSHFSIGRMSGGSNGGSVLVSGAELSATNYGGAISTTIENGGSLVIGRTGSVVNGRHMTVQGFGSNAQFLSDFTVGSGAFPGGNFSVKEGAFAVLESGSLNVARGGSVTVDGPGSMLLSSSLSTVDTQLKMAASGERGTMTVSRGATATFTHVIAETGGSITVDGGTIIGEEELAIGTEGDVLGNRMDVINGGKVSSASGFVGRGPSEANGLFGTGHGVVVIDGDQSEWAVSDSLHIGGSRLQFDTFGQVRKRGLLSVANGGLVSANVAFLGEPEPGAQKVLARGGSVLAIGNADGVSARAGRLAIANGIKIGFFGELVFNHDSGIYDFDTELESIAFRDGLINHRAGVTRLIGPMARFTGDIEVNGGSLAINTDVGATLTTVNNGGRLFGSGSVAGGVRVNSGGTLAAEQDNNPFTMTTLTLSSGANMNVDIAALTPVPLFEVRSDLVLDGIININAPNELGLGMYRVINYGGSLTDRGLDIGTVSGQLDPRSFSVFLGAPGQVNLLYTADVAGAARVGDGNGVIRLGGAGWADAKGLASRLARDDFVILTGPGREMALQNRDEFNELRLSGFQFTSDGFVLRGAPLVFDNTDMQLRVGDGSQAGAGFVATLDTALIGEGSISLRDLGTLIFTGDGSEFSGQFEVASGHLVLGGELGGLLVVQDGATLSGDGTTAMLENNGTLAPGNSPGTIHVLGDFYQNVSGRLVIELGGSPESGLFDVLEVGGTALLGGTLEIRLVDGFIPELGMTFDFLRATFIDGVFDQVLGPVGFNFELENLGDRLVLTATSAVPLPGSVWGLLGGLMILAARTRARRAA